ncbi:MAG: nucleoside-diphosphate sugar epimerase/dehydratase [Propionibacteriales bacterium]|nr:nucleoside-diphosphate sugar epimerase/dehydratase [Propionibacteriales bacterium]
MWGNSERLVALLRQYRVRLMMVTDACAIILATLLLATLRYSDGAAFPTFAAVGLCCLTLVVHFALSWYVKLYRGRSVVGGPDETVMICLIAAASSVEASMVNLIVDPQPVARTVAFGAPLMAATMMILARALWRSQAVRTGWARGEDTRRTVVVGAGEAGQQLVRSMMTTPGAPFAPVAFLDDDPWRRHLRHFGVSVRGTLADLESVVADHGAVSVVVAIPTAPSELIRDLSDRCAAINVDIKVLPPVDEFLGSRVSIRDIRDINIADLLGRSAIETDIESIADFLNGKRVLITGAGGSIGSELARQISKWHPAELMMLDRDESGLHGVQLSIHGHALLDSPDVILADIRDADALNRIFDERRPEVVFHAAALKHLPMLEQYPLEAVKTNVVGTANVLEAARRVGVERFVNISTDKAADPTSILGFSKRAAERLTADYAERDAGSYISVRFGNVLGSRGSVLTTFAGQIAQGGPITVTHPDVTRYFMTVAESVQLVLQAGAIGSDGEVLILDMGEPVKINDVALELIRQSGRKIEIVYTGLREGEKMDEILRSDAELDNRPVHPLISHVKVAARPTSDVLAVAARSTHSDAAAVLRSLCAESDANLVTPAPA